MALRNLSFSPDVAATVAKVATVAAATLGKSPIGDQPTQNIKNSHTESATLTVATTATVNPTGACPACGLAQYWQPQEGGAWHCRSCCADMPATATTITLDCHHPRQPELLRTHAHLEPLLEAACEGLAITGEQLHDGLEDEDLQALASGELSLKALRLTART